MPNMTLLWPTLLIQTALIFAGAMGALQAAALRNGLDGLAWPFGLRHKLLGYAIAVLLMMTTFVGQVVLVLYDLQLSPAWWILVFLVTSGLALLVSILGATVRLQWLGRRQRQSSHWGSPVELGPMRATIYQPTTAKPGPFPAICLLPDPTAPSDDLTPLTHALAENGIVVLTLDWQSSDHSDHLTLQGLVSVGISHLAERAETDPKRVGLAGVGVGGDLALRSTAMDEDVAAVLAIEPVLMSQRPALGLDTLRSLPWLDARRRAHRWRRSPLVKELNALDAAPRATPHPVAIVVGSAVGSDSVGNLEILRVPGSSPFAPAAHKETVQRITQWLREHLTQ
ncbi:MAG: hypothetical protein GY832_04015 [Chloroflexi bacterium]|nr:hypothetical protein [Chloroflexota bacterium]